MVSQAARKDQLDPTPIELSKPTMEFRFVKRRNTKILQQKHMVWNERKPSALPREEWRDVPVAEGEMPDLVKVDGLWWPAVRGSKDHYDVAMEAPPEEQLTPAELEAANKLRSRHGRYARHERDSDAAIKHCKNRRTCVQAGGHVGIWPMRLATKFAKVVTFEPEQANWQCLVRNTELITNITCINCGLDEHAGQGRLAFNGRNIGGHKCRPDGYTREGDTIVPIRMTTIDSYGLTDVDFICLDIEGYEARALRGAERTVERCRPVIMVESWKHGDKIGDPETKLWSWFTRHGYREMGHVSHDYIWVPK